MISGETFIFTLNIFIANNCRFFLRDGKGIILYKQRWKTWLEVLIDYSKDLFMDVVDFIIKTATRKHPDYWTIIKLWKNK